MKISDIKLKGVYIIEPQVFKDNRGFFMESYNEQNMEQNGLDYRFIQDNHSLSVYPGVLRGLHYQLTPKAQTKLIRVIKGAIFDVVVDIRKSSATFGEWFGIELNDENKKQLLVPRGFAHGFCTLVANTEVEYKVDEYYSREHERGILWNDPALNINWPLSEVTLSNKDESLPFMRDAEMNFE